MARINEAETRGRRKAFPAILLLGVILAPACRCAPSFAAKPTWRGDNDIPAILASPCDPSTGRCWRTVDRALPFDLEPEQDLEHRAQPIHARDVELQTRVPEGQEARSRLLRAGPGRPAKKDVFVSRGWGAGGMPFSVLYMSPRVGQGSQGPKADSTRRSDEGAGRTAPTRLALRNGGLGQARRHYSIIPQLFISYGWGPSGK